jgi:hypothetical protein
MGIKEKRILNQITKKIKSYKGRHLFKVDTLSLDSMYNLARDIVRVANQYDLEVGFTVADNLPQNLLGQVVTGGEVLTDYRNGKGQRRHLVVFVNGDINVANSLSDPPFTRIFCDFHSVTDIFTEWYDGELPVNIRNFAEALNQLPELSFDKVINYLEQLTDRYEYSKQWAEALPYLGLFRDVQEYRDLSWLAKRLEKNRQQVVRIPSLLEKAQSTNIVEENWWKDFYALYKQDKFTLLMKYDLADILSIKNGRPPGVMVVQPSPTDQVELLLDQYNVTAKKIRQNLKHLYAFANRPDPYKALENLLIKISSADEITPDKIGNHLPQMGLAKDTSEAFNKLFGRVSTWKKYLQDNKSLVESLDSLALPPGQDDLAQRIQDYLRFKDFNCLYNISYEELAKQVSKEIDRSVSGRFFWLIVCKVASRVRERIPTGKFDLYLRYNKKAVHIFDGKPVGELLATIFDNTLSDNIEPSEITANYQIEAKVENWKNSLYFEIEHVINQDLAQWEKIVWNEAEIILSIAIDEEQNWNSSLRLGQYLTTPENGGEYQLSSLVNPYSFKELFKTWNEKLGGEVTKLFPTEVQKLLELLSTLGEKFAALIHALKSVGGWITYQRGIINADLQKVEEYIDIYRQLLTAWLSFTSKPALNPYLPRLIDNCLLPLLKLGLVSRGKSQAIALALHPLRLRYILAYELKLKEITENLMNTPRTKTDLVTLDLIKCKNRPSILILDNNYEAGEGEKDCILENDINIDFYTEIYSPLTSVRGSRKLKHLGKEILDYLRLFPYAQDRLYITVLNPGTGQAIFQLLQNVVKEYPGAKFSVALTSIERNIPQGMGSYFEEQALTVEDEEMFRNFPHEHFCRTVFSIENYIRPDEFTSHLASNPKQHLIIIQNYFDQKRELAFAQVEKEPVYNIYPTNILVDNADQIRYFSEVKNWRMSLVDATDYMELLFQTLVIQVWKRVNLSDKLHYLYLDLSMDKGYDFLGFFSEMLKYSSWVMVHDKMFGPEMFLGDQGNLAQSLIAFRTYKDKDIFSRLVVASKEKNVILDNFYRGISEFGLYSDMDEELSYVKKTDAAQCMLDIIRKISGNLAIKAVYKNQMAELLGLVISRLILNDYQLYIPLDEYRNWAYQPGEVQGNDVRADMMGLRLELLEDSSLMIYFGVVEAKCSSTNPDYGIDSQQSKIMAAKLKHLFTGEPQDNESKYLNREHFLNDLYQVIQDRAYILRKHNPEVIGRLEDILSGNFKAMFETYLVTCHCVDRPDEKVEEDGIIRISFGKSSIEKMLLCNNREEL